MTGCDSVKRSPMSASAGSESGSYQHFGNWSRLAPWGHGPFAMAFSARMPICFARAAASTWGPKLPACHVAKLVGKRIVSKSNRPMSASAASTVWAEKPRKRTFPAFRAATSVSSAPSAAKMRSTSSRVLTAWSW